jgi:hypothetical protein
MSNLTILIIGPKGEGLSKTANIIHGASSFKENEFGLLKKPLIAYDEKDSLRIVDFPLLSFDGPEPIEDFKHAS